MTLIPADAPADAAWAQPCDVCMRWTGEAHIADHEHCGMCDASLLNDPATHQTDPTCLWCGFVNSPSS